MNNEQYKAFFSEDPWGEITSACYPKGRRLYLNDNRFWVSLNENHQRIFFIHEKHASGMKLLKNLAGIEITVEEFAQDESRLVCTLVSDSNELESKFSIVAKDIAYFCSEFQGQQLFIRVQERIKSWANFLKPQRDGLSQSEYVGFWGELYTLSGVLMPTLNPEDVVRFWVGPDGKKQDVTLNNTSIEIKTSLSGDPRTIKISSLDQLDKVTDSLYLLHINVAPSNNEDGESLEEMYQKCLSYIGHNLNIESLFLQKASDLFGKANKEQLTDKLLIVSLSMYEVSDTFPKLKREDVSAAIVEAKYEIYISALKEFDVTEHLKEIIKNG